MPLQATYPLKTWPGPVSFACFRSRRYRDLDLWQAQPAILDRASGVPVDKGFSVYRNNRVKVLLLLLLHTGRLDPRHWQNPGDRQMLHRVPPRVWLLPKDLIGPREFLARSPVLLQAKEYGGAPRKKKPRAHRRHRRSAPGLQTMAAFLQQPGPHRRCAAPGTREGQYERPETSVLRVHDYAGLGHLPRMH